ncbi:xanthine dehydrogenase family protein subunit M [Streptomyces sp. NBC_00893]|uniref:FAD binding domain-containing protein n=1 Tax=Streptomyces sp. NBC_00893 TaxID=2975862 RepID=UPI00224F7259|nr:xanthine dehydrogenase family protein subunit M [Streptomyces sp. NBC_00893]MCX4844616.1 xanthine dehydrogenase family protein subunit M [Streptomyces sp. NBC_00893]
MHDFGYFRAPDTDTALAVLATAPDARVIAGGTDMVNLLKERIENPALLVDINRVGLCGIHADTSGLHIGALARMSAVLADPAVRRSWPAVAQSLELSASPQLRNAATIGGNLMQRTRCPYFRSETPLPCNKREPGSGCSAAGGHSRTLAVFGWSESCRATHPSDLAVALSALDAKATVGSVAAERTIPLTAFHRLPGRIPERDTALAADELILSLHIPSPRPAERSGYLKVRDRASYEFALVSVAVALELGGRGGNTIQRVRIALGGVAAKPWRLYAAEEALVGIELTPEAMRPAIDLSLADAQPLNDNTFKIELAKRAVVRALVRTGDSA